MSNRHDSIGKPIENAFPVNADHSILRKISSRENPLMTLVLRSQTFTLLEWASHVVQVAFQSFLSYQTRRWSMGSCGPQCTKGARRYLRKLRNCVQFFTYYQGRSFELHCFRHYSLVRISHPTARPRRP